MTDNIIWMEFRLEDYIEPTADNWRKFILAAGLRVQEKVGQLPNCIGIGPMFPDDLAEALAAKLTVYRNIPGWAVRKIKLGVKYESPK